MKLRNFVLMILSISALGFIYWKYFRSESASPSASSINDTTVSGIARLSTFVDKHIDAIFAPLESPPPSVSNQDLKKLREDLADSLRSAPTNEQAMYKTAVDLCDTLINAIAEREKATINLTDSRNKPTAVSLSGDKSRDENDRKQFFESGVIRRWGESAKSHRLRVDALYKQLREMERQLNAQ